jgi:hypothetical protein
MSDEFLGERKKALENEFFAKENAKLLEKLRAEKEKLAAKEALAEASNLRDEQLLDRMVELDIGADTWTAVSLIPLVEVAWADGTLAAKERKAILEAAADTGVLPGKASYGLLESWLASRPGPEMLQLWGEYVVAIAERLDPEGKAILKAEILGRARAVAEAAGGLLGFGNRISPAEQAVLDRLEHPFG